MKTVSAVIFGFIICLCSQAVAQMGYTGNSNFYGGETREWEFKSSVLVLDLKDSNLNQAVIANSNTAITILNATQLSALDTGVGIDASLFKILNNDQRWELRSTFASFNQQFQVRGSAAGNLNDVFNPGFPPASVISFGGAGGQVRGAGAKENRLDYFGIELNLHRAVAPGVSFTAGPKFVNVDDQFSVATVRPNGGGGATLFTADELKTSNRLFGGSVGFDLNLKAGRNLSFSGFFRAGYYANDSTFNRLRATNLTTVVTNNKIRETNGSGIGEFGGFVTYEVIPGTVSLEGGYHAIWVDNAARAFSQVFNAAGGVGTDTLFIQGIRFGLVYRR